MPRTKHQIARAVHRLSAERLVCVAVIAEEISAYSRTVVRWITDGKAGVFLDGLHRPGVGWMTSREALARFEEALLAQSRQADQQELARLKKGGAA